MAYGLRPLLPETNQCESNNNKLDRWLHLWYSSFNAPTIHGENPMDQQQFAKIEALLKQIVTTNEHQIALLQELVDAHLAPDNDDLAPGEEANSANMYLMARQSNGEGGTQLTVFVYTDRRGVDLPTGKCYTENWGALPFVPNTNGPIWEMKATPTKDDAIKAGVMRMLPFTFHFVKKEKPAGAKGGIPGKPIDRTTRVADSHNATIPWKPGEKFDLDQLMPTTPTPSPAAKAAAVVTPTAAPAAPPPPAPTAPTAPAAPATPATPAATPKPDALEAAKEHYKAACRKIAHYPFHTPEHKVLYAALAHAWTSDLYQKGVPNITIISDPRQLTAEQCTYIADSINKELERWRAWWDEAVKQKLYSFPEPESK